MSLESKNLILERRVLRGFEIIGLLALSWMLYLLWVYAPNWTWFITVPAIVLIYFGAFASRDRSKL